MLSSDCAIAGRFVMFGCGGPGRFAYDLAITVYQDASPPPRITSTMMFIGD